MAGQGVVLRGHKVDDGLDGGIHELGGEHGAAAQKQAAPFSGSALEREAHDHGEDKAAHHDFDVALGGEGEDEALDGEGEAFEQRGMVLV